MAGVRVTTTKMSHNDGRPRRTLRRTRARVNGSSVNLRRNAERDRRILYRRLVDGICFEPLAEEFDMSVRQIQNIVYKSQEKLFKHL